MAKQKYLVIGTADNNARAELMLKQNRPDVEFTVVERTKEESRDFKGLCAEIKKAKADIVVIGTVLMAADKYLSRLEIAEKVEKERRESNAKRVEKIRKGGAEQDKYLAERLKAVDEAEKKRKQKDKERAAQEKADAAYRKELAEQDAKNKADAEKAEKKRLKELDKATAGAGAGSE
jgi:hypothetical protein